MVALLLFTVLVWFALMVWVTGRNIKPPKQKAAILESEDVSEWKAPEQDDLGCSIILFVLLLILAFLIEQALSDFSFPVHIVPEK